MKKLEGKVALVTGGTSGIGLAAAKQLIADDQVKASHAVFMTQPKAVADVIDRAAQEAVRAPR